MPVRPDSRAMTSRRLSNDTVQALPASVAIPAYDRARITPGIVHLGVGAFHRAHQAAYVDDCLAAGETGWGIVGVSLRSADTRDALAPQDGLYTLAIRSSGEREACASSARSCRCWWRRKIRARCWPR